MPIVTSTYRYKRLPETPEEHRRRGDAANALFREIQRRIGEPT
jgi:hypothetical protein